MTGLRRAAKLGSEGAQSLAEVGMSERDADGLDAVLGDVTRVRELAQQRLSGRAACDALLADAEPALRDMPDADQAKGAQSPDQ